MNSIIRNVRDIDTRDRETLEHVLGQPLAENQRVIIHVETISAPDAAKLPHWCDVYAGLTEDEIAEVEAISLCRADLTRCAE